MRAEMTPREARALLGVSERAHASEVRRAFRRLVLKHHPDRNPNDPSAQQRFVRLCLAYDVLTGARAAAPDAPPAAGRDRTTPQPPGWPAPPWAPYEPKPRRTKYEDGNPVHYPTPEEIASLNEPDAFAKNQKRLFTSVVLGMLALIGALAVLEAVSDQMPAKLDAEQEALRRSLGKNWGIPLRP
jgi:hypothetical protein